MAKWIIGVIAIIVVIALAAVGYVLTPLGIFPPAPTTFIQITNEGFEQIELPLGGWVLQADGNFLLQITNTQDSPMTIKSISTTLSGVTQTSSHEVVIESQRTETISTLPNMGKRVSGSFYTMQLSITFVVNGEEMTETGTLSGTVL